MRGSLPNDDPSPASRERDRRAVARQGEGATCKQAPTRSTVPSPWSPEEGDLSLSRHAGEGATQPQAAR